MSSALRRHSLHEDHFRSIKETHRIKSRDDFLFNYAPSKVNPSNDRIGSQFFRGVGSSNLVSIDWKSLEKYRSIRPIIFSEEDFSPYWEKKELVCLASQDKALLLESLSFCNWCKLIEYCDNNPSAKRKILSELGFAGNSLLSILETVVWLPACLIVGNKISHYIAQGINFFANIKRNDDQILINYLELRKKLNRSLGRNVESVAQNCTSLGTNLMRSGYQERAAQKINDHVVDDSEKVLSIFEHVLSPFFILKLALGILPTGTDMVTFYSDMEKYDPKYYSRERSNSL